MSPRTQKISCYLFWSFLVNCKFIYKNRDWLRNIKKETSSSNFEGWSEPQLLQMVMSRRHHHICSHGGTHIPYSELHTAPEAIDADIQLILQQQAATGINTDSIIYPRNIIGYREKLRIAGFRGFRNIDIRENESGIIARIRRLAYEFVSTDNIDLLDNRAQYDFPLVRQSSGKFFNARIGLRRIVTNNVTCQRVDKMLSTLISHGGTLHFYSHPHNFLLDSGLFSKLDYLLSKAEGFRQRGELNIITMKEEIDGVV